MFQIDLLWLRPPLMSSTYLESETSLGLDLETPSGSNCMFGGNLATIEFGISHLVKSRRLPGSISDLAYSDCKPNSSIFSGLVAGVERYPRGTAGALENEILISGQSSSLSYSL